MTEETKTAEAEEATTEVRRLDIINGRIPLPLVYMIRFEEGDAKDSEVAAKYFTSTGKVSDIRKNRNFAYITEETKFSSADITAAKEWLRRPSLQGNHIAEDVQAQVSKALDTLPVDDKAAEAITEARKAARKAKATETAGASDAGGEEGKGDDGGLSDAI